MKKFDYPGLRQMLRTPESAANGSDADAVLNEFADEVYDYCRREKDPAQLIRILRFTRGELASHTGAGKKRGYQIAC